jgi:4-hydroxy-tetrahydrodipicolinate synthase
LSREAEASGADAILSVVPYYNKPTQEGLYAHFSEIATSTGLPIILYDIPSRTGLGLADDTIAGLAEVPRIIGLKDATGDVGRVSRLRALVGWDFRLLSGDDATALGYFAQGGDGCISVVSNVAPGLCRNMYSAWRHGDVTRARRLTLPLAQLTAALSREANPAPLKYALSSCGLMLPKLRLPLVDISEETRHFVSETLERLAYEYLDCLIESSHVLRCCPLAAAY